MKIKKAMALFLAVFFLVMTATPALAWGFPDIKIPENVMDSPPPTVTMGAVDAYAFSNDLPSTYVKAITSIVYDGKTLLPGTGFSVLEPQQQYPEERLYFRIALSNGKASGDIMVLIKAKGYFDAGSSFNISSQSGPILQSPPNISADNTTVANRITIFVGDEQYLSKVTAVEFNGKNITDIAKGSPAPDSGEILIDESYNTTAGTFEMVVKATGYQEAKCGISISAAPKKTPPVFAAQQYMALGDKPILSLEDANYANAVTKVLAPVFTDFEKAKGDFSPIGKTLVFSQPVEVAGTYPLKLLAAGYEDATVSITVKPLAPPALTAKDIYEGEYPVITATADFADSISKVSIDGVEYNKKDYLAVNGGTLTIKVPMPKAGTKGIVFYSYRYAMTKCSILVTTRPLPQTPGAIVIPPVQPVQPVQPQQPQTPASGKKELRFYVGNSEYYIDNKLNTMDTTPVISGGRTLLPIKYAAAPLGATVDWNASEQKVTVKTATKTIELWIGKNTAKINGVATLIDPGNTAVQPVILPPGRTMLPLRFVTENLGCDLEWNPSTKEVKITAK